MIESPWTPCCGRYYSRWLVLEVSVRSLKTLCTCGLGGALLNICIAWLTAQSLQNMRYRHAELLHDAEAYDKRSDRLANASEHVVVIACQSDAPRTRIACRY